MKVLSRQGNTRKCIICGMENDLGLKASFYNLDDGSVASIFKFSELHQSYPDRTHGGMVAALLDELMGRVIWHSEGGQDKLNLFAVTMSLSVKYRKPTPYGVTLKARAYYVKNTSRAYVSKGELYDMDGNLLVEAEASYIKVKPEDVENSNAKMHEEMAYHFATDIEEIEF